MRYSCEITIDRPRDEVIALFEDPENMKHWQPTLKSFEPISGQPGKVGSKSRLVYDMNGRDMVMTETITQQNFPESFSAVYDADNVHNVMDNHFYAEDDKTRWVATSEFRFSGWMRLMALIMREGSFKKESMENMQRFKSFAESG
ncbi:MAG: SRPBCC family protein [Anaerolineae bacterium]|nr:SRPBCC family protein [Anaerolineae bacterium]